MILFEKGMKHKTNENGWDKNSNEKINALKRDLA